MNGSTSQNMKWKPSTLGGISTDIAYGYTASASLKEVGPKFLRITDIQSDFIDWDKVPFCQIDEKKHKKYQLELGDVVVARTGNSTGATSVIKEPVNAVFASYLIRYKLNPKEADFRFIDFVLRSPAWSAFVKSNLGGSAQAGANAKVFAAFPLLLPPLPEQKAIAAVLSSLDDKIELLRRQNETLEKIAQAIFKEWVVEFNFPDKGGKPYKASGGKMVDSELGPIPAGWRVGALSDIAAVDWGNTSITKSSYVNSGEYLGVSAAGCDGRMAHKEHVYGAFVISAIGEYCGRVFLPNEDFTAIKNTLVVTQRSVRYSYFAYLGVQTWPMHRRGAAQPFLSKGDTEQVPFANPGPLMIESFIDSVSPLFCKLRRNSLQIGTLAKLRDALLPKLMSGEIRTKDTKRINENTA